MSKKKKDPNVRVLEIDTVIDEAEAEVAYVLLLDYKFQKGGELNSKLLRELRKGAERTKQPTISLALFAQVWWHDFVDYTFAQLNGLEWKYEKPDFKNGRIAYVLLVDAKVRHGLKMDANFRREMGNVVKRTGIPHDKISSLVEKLLMDVYNNVR